MTLLVREHSLRMRVPKDGQEPSTDDHSGGLPWTANASVLEAVHDDIPLAATQLPDHSGCLPKLSCFLPGGRRGRGQLRSKQQEGRRGHQRAQCLSVAGACRLRPPKVSVRPDEARLYGYSRDIREDYVHLGLS